MSDELLQEISAKIDHLVLLSATNTVKGLKPNEAILILGEVGLDRNLIARIVGTTAATVSVRLSEARARKAREGKKKNRG
jgi:CRP-like cAMP-binding protein